MDGKDRKGEREGKEQPIPYRRPEPEEKEPSHQAQCS
jgi:hypothetical protein